MINYWLRFSYVNYLLNLLFAYIHLKLFLDQLVIYLLLYKITELKKCDFGKEC